ncbi:MAG TPA: alpha/beta hydrolase, partial [Chitinophagaceae bacterium]|nr:alpha/beta hydrolase [Chitinophagaceae bacterium]
MKKQVLFIQGGGDDGYTADTKMVTSLIAALGNDYEVNYPPLQSDEERSDFGWTQQIGQLINETKGDIIIAGHSLGASLILKYLSETNSSKLISGIFLLAPPFWSGDEEWKQGLILRKDFSEQLRKDIPLYLYQCKDDDVVPFEQHSLYVQKLPHAIARVMDEGGHYFNDE